MKKIIFGIITFFLIIIKINAASFSFTANNTNVILGQSTRVILTGNSLIGGFSLTSSNSNIIAIPSGSNRIWIENNTEYIMLKGLKEGTVTITVTPITVSDLNGIEQSLASKSITFKVSKPVPIIKSSNNKISSLTINNGEVELEFNSDVLEYNINLPADTSEVEIDATLADNKAQISGIGLVKLEDGMNVVELIVTAENGDQKKYLLNIDVEVKNPIKVKIGKKTYYVVRKKSELPEVTLYDSIQVNIGKEEVPGFYNKKNKLTLVGLKDEKGIISLYVYDQKKYIKYEELNFNNIVLYLYSDFKNKIPNNYKKSQEIVNGKEVVGYKINDKSKYVLLYGMNVETGKEGLYLYDGKENTIQRYYQDEIKLLKNNLLITFVITVVLLIISIVLIVVLIKKSKNVVLKT